MVGRSNAVQRAKIVALTAAMCMLPAAVMSQTTGQREYERAMREANARMMRIVYEPLGAFENEPQGNCGSENLKLAITRAVQLARAINDDDRMKFDARLAAGIGIADVGDSAKRRRCTKQARAMYDLIIEVYVGTAYEGLRKRAEIGITDLRN